MGIYFDFWLAKLERIIVSTYRLSRKTLAPFVFIVIHLDSVSRTTEVLGDGFIHVEVLQGLLTNASLCLELSFMNCHE